MKFISFFCSIFLFFSCAIEVEKVDQDLQPLSCINRAINPPNCDQFSPCTNGATNPPTCDICPTGQIIYEGVCRVPCDNEAINPPACDICPAGYTMVGDTCRAPCDNGATNPPACDTCPAGKTMVGTECVNNCTNGAINPPSCDKCEAPQTWDGEKCISLSKSKVAVAVGAYPNIAVDSVGDVHLVYARDSKLWYKKLNSISKTWGAEQDVGFSIQYASYKNLPQIAVDSLNRPHVIGGGTTNEGKYAYWNGSSWIQIGSFNRDTGIAIDNLDTVYVNQRNGNEGGNIGLFKRTKEKTSFSKLPDPDISDGLPKGDSDHVYGSTFINPVDNSVHLVYRRGAPQNLAYRGSENGGENWFGGGISTQGNEGPHGVVDGKGTIYAVSGNGTVYQRTGKPSSWKNLGNPVGGGSGHLPRLSTDKTNTLYISSFGGKFSAYRSAAWSGLKTVPVFSGMNRGHTRIYGASNFAYIVWEEGNNVLERNDNEYDTFIIMFARVNSDGTVEAVNSTPVLTRSGNIFYLDSKPISQFGIRVANALQGDQISQRLIDSMDIMKNNGMQSFSVCIQGGKQGDTGGSAFNGYYSDGGLKAEYSNRLLKILNAAAEKNMVLSVVFFYFGNDQELDGNTAVKNAVQNTVDWLKPWRNVWLNIINEPGSSAYDIDILKTSSGWVEIYNLAKSRDSARIVYVAHTSGANDGFKSDTWTRNGIGPDMNPGDVVIEYARGDTYSEPGVFGMGGIYKYPPEDVDYKERASYDASLVFDIGGYFFWHAAWHQKSDLSGWPRFDKGGAGTKSNPGVSFIWNTMYSLSK